MEQDASSSLGALNNGQRCQMCLPSDPIRSSKGWPIPLVRSPSQSEVRTHLRNMVIVPEMIGSIIGVYNGKTFNQVEIKHEMIGHYLAEVSISYKPVKHGRPGIGATHSSRFIPLK